MIQDFSESMSNRTDENLIKIVTIDRNDYQVIAVEAAEKELKKRNIDPAKFESVKHDIEKKESKDKEINTGIVSSWIRLINAIIDTICLFILMFFISFLLGLILLIFRDFVIINEIFTTGLLGFLTILSAFFLYFIYLEFRFQRTIGKFITNTKVIMTDGRKPELNDIFIRTVCRLIPLDNISYLFMKNGLHDRLSNSIVVKDEKTAANDSLD